MNYITINSHRFSYTISRKPIKSLTLRLTSKSSFAVSAPIFISNQSINNFIQKHQNWILKHSKQFHTFPQLSSLKSLKIIGQTYLLTFNKSTKNKIIFKNKKIYIYSNTFTQTHLKKLFQKYFKPFAKKLITDELHQLQTQIKFKYNQVSVKNQKSRYGSCSSRQNLNFNWQIIFFPYSQFRHIILHEVVHLLEKNHQQSFWQTLSRYDPNWRHHNRWLKTQASRCFIIKP